MLNQLSRAPGSKKSPVRVGRGIGSGKGKTSGKGHKGQRARAGGYHKINFEGGQMPIQRRLPKTGFTSMSRKLVDEVTLSEINALPETEISLEILKQHGLVLPCVKRVSLIASGKLTRAITLKAVRLSKVRVTKGAKTAIEAAGGSVEVAG